MPSNPSLGPTRKACSRCRLHKRKCDKTQPSCSLCNRLGQAELCVYEETVTYPTPPERLEDDSLCDGTSISEALTPVGVKMNIIAKLSDTDLQKVMSTYSETIHPWFGILSHSKLHAPFQNSWDIISVDFALVCFAIMLLNCAPQELHGTHTLHPTHKSMYLMSKTWIALLEAAGLNSVDFVKARLFVTLFEVSHGFSHAAYLSIANVVRAADALDMFQQQELSQSSAEYGEEEHRLMWWGIMILDRFIATENSKQPPVTKSRLVPPTSLIQSSLNVQEYPSSAFSRLFEASTLLDHVNTALHQPTSQISFNIEEVTTIVMTLMSFESVVTQMIPEKSRLFCSCLALSSTALLLAYNNGSKATCSGASISAITQATAAMDILIDDIVKRVEVLHDGNSLVLEEKPIPSVVVFLVYKAATITTTRLQDEVNAEANLQRLKILRSSLAVLACRWLVGEYYLNLLNEDTPPRVMKALGS